MDGAEGKMSRSLQFRLSAWLSAVILATAAAGGVFSFVNAFEEANELQDDQLRQIAALVSRQGLSPPSARAQEAEPVSDTDSRVIVQMLTPSVPHAPDNGHSGRAAALSAHLPDGMQTVNLHGQPWRVFVETLAGGERIAVAQKTAVRDETARGSALRTVMPFAILVPLLLLVAGLLIRNMFRPVSRLAFELDERSDRDLRALSPAGLPREIVPFVVAINRLLSRVENSVALQRRFVANAAHELRSPLTALSLQAERLEAVALPEQAKERFAALKSGIHRARTLLDQLLAYARVQETPAAAVAPTSMRRVMRQVLEDMLPLAESKSIDIGMVEDADAHIAASELDLRTLVGNLVDNAIRYTPRGGRVDLSVTPDGGSVVFRVSDSGPGIPAAERERVFDPFYRVLGSMEIGSGLGLSIVKAIADRIGASVTLREADNVSATGLSVAVDFGHCAQWPSAPGREDGHAQACGRTE